LVSLARTSSVSDPKGNRTPELYLERVAKLTNSFYRAIKYLQ